MPMLMSFCLMVRPRRMRMSESVRLGDDPLGQADELRAHLEPRPIHLLRVDLEADDVVPQLEGDHSPPVREVAHLAHGEYGGACELIQDLRKARLLGVSDEADPVQAPRCG